MTLQCSACRGAHTRVELVWRCHMVIGQAEKVAAAAWADALGHEKKEG